MELWDLYNEHRQPLGRVHRRQEPVPAGAYHLVVNIWTVNSKNQVLLTLRAPQKEDNPNLWENTRGSVVAGESSLEGAVRELAEETGLVVAQGELAFLDSICESCYVIDFYAVRKDAQLADLTMQYGETTDARWVSFEELDKLIADGTVAFPVAERLALIRSKLEEFVFGK